MVNERLNSYSPENADGNTENYDKSDFPPFNPDNARKLYEEAKASSRAEETPDDGTAPEKPVFDPTLYANESEWRIANHIDEEQTTEDEAASSEYDFKNIDRYQEDTFMLAAADSLVDSPDIMRIDRVISTVKENASRDGTSEYEALKTILQDPNLDEDSVYAASDLMSAFIETSSTYVVNKDEKIGRGFAKGLLTKLEMTIDSAATDVPNPRADTLRVDLALVKPIIEEFVDGYEPTFDDPNDFNDYLKTVLDMEQSDIRFAKMRGEQPAPDAERRVQAIKSVMEELENMQSTYQQNLNNLQNSAFANHRIIK